MAKMNYPTLREFHILLGIAGIATSFGIAGCDCGPPGGHAAGPGPDRAAEPGQPGISTPPAPDADGASLYVTACAGCHQLDGGGLGSDIPPLAGSAWVTGDQSQLIKIMLHGMRGPVGVKGESYSLEMPPAGIYSDEQLAAVASSIRREFGNQASLVEPETVAKLRAEHAGRRHAWTADDLEEP